MMNRRQFLQSLTLIPLANYIKQNAETEHTLTQRKILETVPVAGFQYYQDDNLWSELKINDTLYLSREADNEFDKNAILIKWKDRPLGYIPRVDNKPFAKLLDNGESLSAEILKLENSSNPWERVEVALYQLM